MASTGKPAELPQIALEIVTEQAPFGEPGFLSLLRRIYRAHYPDGTASRPFEYDQVQRRARDAVVFVAHFVGDKGRYVYLRSALRPPLLDRNRTPNDQSVLWELPAGLIEPEEESPTGIVLAAQRELEEELGFRCAPKQFSELGQPAFLSPGMISEKLYFFEVQVHPAQQQQPALDGSPLEHGGKVQSVALRDALRWCEIGIIEDVKTELGLRRFAERFA